MATEFQWRQKQFQIVVRDNMCKGPSSFFRVILLREFKKYIFIIFKYPFMCTFSQIHKFFGFKVLLIAEIYKISYLFVTIAITRLFTEKLCTQH